MKRKAIDFLRSVFIRPKAVAAPAPVYVHSTNYRLKVEGMEDLREGWMCYCDVAGCHDLVQKVVTHKQLRAYLGADECEMVPRTFHPGADNEHSDFIPYCLWLADNKADLDSYMESIINEREGRTKDRPAVAVQPLHLIKKAA